MMSRTRKAETILHHFFGTGKPKVTKRDIIDTLKGGLKRAPPMCENPENAGSKKRSIWSTLLEERIDELDLRFVELTNRVGRCERKISSSFEAEESDLPMLSAILAGDKLFDIESSMKNKMRELAEKIRMERNYILENVPREVAVRSKREVFSACVLNGALKIIEGAIGD